MKELFLGATFFLVALVGKAIVPPAFDTHLIHQKIDSLLLDKSTVNFQSDFFTSLIFLNDSLGYYNPEGSLHLFELNFNRNPISVRKLSKSIHHGHNFKRSLFVYKSEIYSAGGEGLFNTFSGIIKFDSTSNEWFLIRISGFPETASKINAAWLSGDSLSVILTISNNNSESYHYGKIDLKTRTYLNIKKLEQIAQESIARIRSQIVHESPNFFILQIKLENNCRYLLFNKETFEEISTTFLKEVPCIDGHSAVYTKDEFIYYRDSNGDIDSAQLSENIIYNKKRLFQKEESSGPKIIHWVLSIVVLTGLIIGGFKFFKTKQSSSLIKEVVKEGSLLDSSDAVELISELEHLLMSHKGTSIVTSSMDQILKISHHAPDTIRAKRSAYIKAINQRGVLRITRTRGEKDKRYFEYKIE